MRGNFAVPAPCTVDVNDADGINQNDHTQIYLQTVAGLFFKRIANDSASPWGEHLMGSVQWRVIIMP
jgi:hypothetical protein